MPLKLDKCISLFLLAVFFNFSAPAYSESPPVAPPPEVEMAQKARQLQQQIFALQDAALKADPALVSMHQEFERLVNDTVKAQGGTPDADNKRMAELHQQSLNPEISREEMQKISMEFAEIQQKLSRQQQEALQVEKVMLAQERFRKQLMIEMMKINPGAKGMVMEFEAIMSKLNAAPVKPPAQ
jgi:hypothetical protein